MTDHKNADGLSRRQFVQLSGVVGAAAVLGGGVAGVAAGKHAFAARILPARPRTDLCGNPSDTGDRFVLWEKAQDCADALKKKKPNPPGCMGTTDDYVVLNGKSHSDHDFLLVPTRRVMGIECPYIWSNTAPNYWKAAWDEAQRGGASPVRGGTIGLGINSKQDRDQDQLHIHMAQILSGVQKQLEDAKHITTDPRKWKYAIVSVVGLESGRQDARYYRVLRVKDLQQNLFALLQDNVAGTSDMAIQTMIVTERDARGGGFYVLNSDPTLTGPTRGQGGTGTCDSLLKYD